MNLAFFTEVGTAVLVRSSLLYHFTGGGGGGGGGGAEGRGQCLLNVSPSVLFVGQQCHLPAVVVMMDV